MSAVRSDSSSPPRCQTVALWLVQARSWVRLERRECRLLLVYGIGWFGIYNVALNAAERHLDAGTTAMLVNVGPILIALPRHDAARRAADPLARDRRGRRVLRRGRHRHLGAHDRWD